MGVSATSEDTVFVSVGDVHMCQNQTCRIAAADLIQDVDHVDERFLSGMPERQEMFCWASFCRKVLKITKLNRRLERRGKLR